MRISMFGLAVLTSAFIVLSGIMFTLGLSAMGWSFGCVSLLTFSAALLRYLNDPG